MVIPAAIETTRRSVPADLRAAPWDSPRMVRSYRTLVARLAAHLSQQVRYVSIANEADVYLSTHPGQLPAFVRFARAEISELHRRAPFYSLFDQPAAACRKRSDATAERYEDPEQSRSVATYSISPVTCSTVHGVLSTASRNASGLSCQ
jgi:hypothetical protein